MKIKIAITDEEQLFRNGIHVLLEREENLEILFGTTNAQELIDTIDDENLPDIILIDVQKPFLNGVETTKFIHKKYPSIKIIVLTSYSSKSAILNMIDNGASSYLLKSTNIKTVVKTIKEVFQKGFHYDDMVLKIINEYVYNSKKTNLKKPLEESFLSERELQILALICSQLTTGEIAEKLNISPRTVDGHRHRLLLKTASKNIAGLVIYGIQKQLIEVSV